VISNSKQTWDVEQTVKVGFLTLVVKAAIPTPGDGMPDAYILTNKAGDKLYAFVPHNGLRRIDAKHAIAHPLQFANLFAEVA
jgi:hypothetical protein